MPDYAKTVIYKLYSDNLPADQIYWGHTTTALKKRLSRHVSDRNCVSRRIIEAGSYHIEEVEKWPCKNKNEALWRERWWIENKSCMNRNLPILTEEERKIKWRLCSQEQTNKNKETQKRWVENNRERAKEHKRKSRAKPENAEKNRRTSKKWWEANRERVNANKRRRDRANRWFTQFCNAFDIDADFKGVCVSSE